MQQTSQLLQIAYNKSNIQYYGFLRQQLEKSQISYWIGNPSVQIINGNITLKPLLSSEKDIKKLTEQCQTLQQYLQTVIKLCSKSAIQTKYLVLCGIPNNKPPIQATQVFKPYLQCIQEMRVIKTVDIRYYAILILMDSIKSAEIIFRELFGRQYNSLQMQRIVFRVMQSISMCFSQLIKQQCSANQLKLFRQIKQGEKVSPEYIFMRTNKQISNIQSTQKKLKKMEDLIEIQNEKKQKQLRISPEKIVRKLSHNTITPSKQYTINNKNLICAICLDQAKSQLFSILCGHYFDWQCLQKWQQDTCPLCRFHQQPPIIKFCQLCNQCEGLWVCLICGVRLCCGSQNNILGQDSHIYKHYKQTHHCLSMQLQTKFLFDASKPAFLHQMFYNQIKKNQINMQKMQQGKKDTKLKIQVQQYEKNITQQMMSQRQYFEQSLNKIIKKHMVQIDERRNVLDKLNKQIEQIDINNNNVNEQKQTLNKQLTNLQKQYDIIKNMQKILLKKIEQKKLISNKKQKQRKILQLEISLRQKKEQLKDYRKNLIVKGKIKDKIKNQGIQQDFIFANQKTIKKKK